MAVHRPQIGKAHIFKQAAGQQGLFNSSFNLMCYLINSAAQGEDAHQLAVSLFELQILGLKTLMGQMLSHAAYTAGNRHSIIIENDDQRLAAVACVGQPLVGQSPGQCSIPQQRQDMIIFFL